ncbi:hypothetical protein ACF0H5_000702 [Mactra antiquata]
MGVDIGIYRSRIGLFMPRRKSYNSKRCKSKYNPYSSTSDIHYRVFASCFINMTILFCVYGVLLAHTWMKSIDIIYREQNLMVDNMYHSVSPSITCSALCDNQDSSNLMFYDIAQYKLMLSSDVETNPGPADLETILDAIKQSEEKVLNQIMSVKSEITDIKNDISTIHKDHLKLQSEVNEIREKQASYEEILKSTHQHVDVLEEITENLRLDIDHVNNTAETHYDTLSRLTEEVERLNIKSISNNMRVFGLSVENISTYSDLVKYVLENVLKIAFQLLSGVQMTSRISVLSQVVILKIHL